MSGRPTEQRLSLLRAKSRTVFVALALALSVSYVSALAAPSTSQLQLPALPGLPASLSPEPVDRAEIFKALGPQASQTISSGYVDVAARRWTNDATIAVTDVIFTTDFAGFAQRVVDERKAVLGAPALSAPGVAGWRDVAGPQGLRFDDIYVWRGANLAKFVVYPSGGLTDAQLDLLTAAQLTLLPEYVNDAPGASEIARAAGEVIWRFLFLGGFVWLLVFLVRRARGRRSD